MKELLVVFLVIIVASLVLAVLLADRAKAKPCADVVAIPGEPCRVGAELTVFNGAALCICQRAKP